MFHSVQRGFRIRVSFNLEMPDAETTHGESFWNSSVRIKGVSFSCVLNYYYKVFQRDTQRATISNIYTHLCWIVLLVSFYRYKENPKDM